MTRNAQDGRIQLLNTSFDPRVKHTVRTFENHLRYWFVVFHLCITLMVVCSISDTNITINTIITINIITNITINIIYIIATKVWGATVGAGIQWLGQLGLSQMQVKR